MAHDVFVSYAAPDRTTAFAVVAGLEAEAIRCWVSPRDVLPGSEYGQAIVDAIKSCQVMVVVFSAEANNSPHVRREVERAMSAGRIIIPFRIDDTPLTGAMEYCLGNTHWLDAITPPLEEHIMILVGTMSRRLGVPSVLASERMPVDPDRRGDVLEPPSVGSSFEPFFSVGPGDNAGWALVFRILNSGRRDVTIRRAVYFLDPEKRVPILPDAKRSQVHLTGFEVKFGEQWKLLECFLKPGDEAISYVPLQNEVELPQGVRGELLLEYEVGGRTARHRAAL